MIDTTELAPLIFYGIIIWIFVSQIIRTLGHMIEIYFERRRFKNRRRVEEEE